MTDFESKNLHPVASLDHLSLKNWSLGPFESDDDEVETSEGEQSSESSEDVTSNDVEGIVSLIPEMIRESCKNPKTAELRVSYDAPTMQYTYTYAISWDDEDDDGSIEKKFAATSNESNLDSVLEAKMKKTSSLCLAPPLVPVDTMCDGPCKKVFPSNLLCTIGRCGHYLCTACYGIVKNSDGTVGCSSLSCFWKGTSREESKKNYDEEVRRKQRAKAKELIGRGIDVKPASRANSSLEISSTLNSSKSSNSSKTNLSSCTNHSSILTGIIPSTKSIITGPLSIVPSVTAPPPPPKTDSPVRVRFIVVEPTEQYGMTHTYCDQTFRPDTKLIAALKTMLIRKQRRVDDYIPNGKIYYGTMRENGKFGMRGIKAKKVSDVVVGDIPKLGLRVVLIMDMGDYVTDGVKIYLEQNRKIRTSKKK